MNESRTCAGGDTDLTPPRSGFDLEDTRRALIATRVKYGADTPIGHRCSNIVEMLENRSPPAAIAKQMVALDQLLNGSQ